MAQRNVTDEAFVTLATNDVYCRGALVLAESLKRHGTARRLVVMITPHVSAVARNALSEVFDFVTDVNVLDSNDAAHLALLKRPELGITFTKIHCWTLTQFKKCVFMDADMLALTNVDELFDREEISAASDSGWPDLFNSGLFVFRPSMETFYGLLQLAEREGSFDGGDQGLLNTYFSSWLTSDISRHLSFLYNLHVTASYTYLPAFKRFGKDTKVVHFLGPVKPWHHVYNRISGAVKQVAGPQDQGYQQFPAFLTRWWEIYNDKIRNFFSNEDEIMAEEISALSQIIVIPAAFIPPENEARHEYQSGESSSQNGSHRTPEQIKQDLYSHMRDWEEGRIDYKGRDSFANIQAHIDANIKH